MAESLLFERRLLVACTFCTLLGYLLEIIAVSTDYWLMFTIPGGLYVNETGRYLNSVRSGLWRICKLEVDKSGEGPETERCESHNFFPTTKEIIYDESIDRQILDYMRTGCAFGIITLILMFLGHTFAFYAIRRPRYVIKRLTALLHIMTGACVIVMNEVFIRTVEYAGENLPERLPKNADHKYGFSFILSWIVFVFYIGSGLIFLFMSRKRKTEMSGLGAVIAEEDEPIQIGR